MDLTIRTEFDEDAACELYRLDTDQLSRRLTANPPVGHWIAYD